MSNLATPIVDIAVLDDDHDFRNYIADFLGDEGLYTVRAFAHPDDLFAACNERRPDIVLLDMMMGESRGDKVLEELLLRWPKLCVIIITGYPSLEDMRATFRMKVFDYLAKPFSLSQLRQILRNAIDAFGLGRGDPGRLRQGLGHRIRMMRTDRSWSLRELADASELSVSQISSIERGTHLPSMESLLAISRAFGQRPSEILSSIDF